MKIQLGISTCPNDTFMFHAIIHRKIDLAGLDFEIQYLDVQELNERLAERSLDCSKASFHAAIHLANDYGVLPSGAALGHRVGPVLLSKSRDATPQPTSQICCPGSWTTATLLFRLAYPEATNIEQRVFSDIMPGVAAGEFDFGVVIHEGVSRIKIMDCTLPRTWAKSGSHKPTMHCSRWAESWRENRSRPMCRISWVALSANPFSTRSSIARRLCPRCSNTRRKWMKK